MGFFDDKQAWLVEVFAQYPATPEGRRSAIMPMLRLVQQDEGWISPERQEEIAQILGTTATEVAGVMSFYSYYQALPTGKYHLQVCATLSCAIGGSDELWDELVNELQILRGDVSDDGLFSIQKVECLGSCHTAPVIQVNDEPYVECVTKARLHAILRGLRQGKRLEDILLPGKAGHAVHTRGDEVKA
jgi:NADH-quinone oxidoreductase subunit E